MIRRLTPCPLRPRWNRRPAAAISVSAEFNKESCHKELAISITSICCTSERDAATSRRPSVATPPRRYEISR